MLRLALCATLSFTLLGCGEPIHSLKRSTFVKTCPHLRTFYSLQNKLYLKEGNNYQEVERHGDDVCNDQIARFNPYGGLRDPWTSVVTGRVLLEGKILQIPGNDQAPAPSMAEDPRWRGSAF